MQLVLLGLVIGVFMHDALPSGGARVTLEGWSLAVLVLAPKAMVAATYLLMCRVTVRRLGKADGPRALRWLDIGTALFRWSALVLYILDLWTGLLVAIRGTLGGLFGVEPANVILLDELLVIAPTLGMFIFGWWAYYPVERRLRLASTMSQLDAGGPVQPVWTRWQYIVSQLRHQAVIILAPTLLMFGWYEVVDRFAPQESAVWRIDPKPILMLFGMVCIFTTAPLMIARLWDTAPLPKGELRDSLMAMCRKYKVGVRDLLLWRTFGGMVNGAVMGVVAPLRYILLTDALLDQMPKRHVEAVMAHELAHVHKKHMFWLLVIAFTLIGVGTAGWTLGLQGLGAALPLPDAVADVVTDRGFVEGSAIVLAMVTWVVCFGWVSRRFERQADAFAVRHLAGQLLTVEGETEVAAGSDADPDPAATPSNREQALRVSPEAADAMADALGAVAKLNHIPVNGGALRHWRHGSIAWRQRYLRSLVGKPVDDLPIDHQVGWIKLAGLVGIVTLVLLETSIGF